MGIKKIKRRVTKEEENIILNKIKSIEDELDTLEDEYENLKVLYEEKTGKNYHNYHPYGI